MPSPARAGRVRVRVLVRRSCSSPREVSEALWCVAWFFVPSIPAFLGLFGVGWGRGDRSGELAARPPRRRRQDRGHLGPVEGCSSRGGGAGRAGLWPRAWAGMRASSPAPRLGTARGSSTEDRRRGDPDSELSNRFLWPKVGGSGEIGVGVVIVIQLASLAFCLIGFFTLLTFEAREVGRKKKVRNVVKVSPG